MWNNYKVLTALSAVFKTISLLMLLLAASLWLRSSDLFPVKTIRIEGVLKNVTQEQLQFIAKHELRGTFFSLDIDKTRSAFEKLPWVKQAQIRRRWPDQLSIAIVEYKALARWGVNGLVSTDNVWFDAASGEDLPTLKGPEGSVEYVAKRLPKIQAYLAPANLKVDELEVSSRGAWQVRLDNGITLKLGQNELDQKLQRFTHYWISDLEKIPYTIDYIDLRYSSGFAVKMPDYKISNLKPKQS